MRLPILLSLFALSVLSAQAPDPNKSGYPHDMTWFNVPKSPQPGIVHKGYHSFAMDKEIGYNIYLPPGYESGSKRYPVVYWLHGRGGTESSDGYPLHYLSDGIQNGTLPPMILIYVSGGSQSNYCDSYDGKYLAETTVIKELIPHIDKTYRTIASREGRSIQGMSMGGFGAMRLGLKYPDLFSSIVAFAGGYRWVDDMPEAHLSFAEMYNSNPEVFREAMPETAAKRNLDRIRGKMTIQMYCGTTDGSVRYNRRMHKVLDGLEIPHGYREIEGVPHNLRLLSDNVKDENFAIAAKAFGSHEK